MTTRYLTLAYGDSADVYSQSAMLLISLLAHAPAPSSWSWLPIGRSGSPGSAAPCGWSRSTAASSRPGAGRRRSRCASSSKRSGRTGPGAGAIVLLDADVLAREPLDSFEAALSAGEVFMHKQEYEFGRSKRRGNRALWNELRGRSFAGWEVQSGDAMWNSGVLAAPAADRGLFDQVLQFYDAIAAAGGRHFATEQLVEGVVLGRTGRLRPAARWFTHYWGNKAAHTAAIDARLAAARSEGLSVEECAARYRQDPIDLPDEVRLTAREKVARWLARLRYEPAEAGRQALVLKRRATQCLPAEAGSHSWSMAGSSDPVV